MSNFLWTKAPTQKKNVISLFSRKFSIRTRTQKWRSKCAVGQCNKFDALHSWYIDDQRLETNIEILQISLERINRFKLFWRYSYCFIELARCWGIEFWPSLYFVHKGWWLAAMLWSLCQNIYLKPVETKRIQYVFMLNVLSCCWKAVSFNLACGGRIVKLIWLVIVVLVFSGPVGVVIRRYNLETDKRV